MVLIKVAKQHHGDATVGRNVEGWSVPASVRNFLYYDRLTSSAPDLGVH